MIKKYIKNNQTFYMVNNLYLGINPITGKEIRKSKKGFKTKKSAQIYINKLKSEYDSGNL
ncbi:Arm DNA-binding domain-containing protein, partial [Streptococcus danieliae]|nr:Arm DNA-binding domain-containing protein [Streptococcus danieliae]